MDLVEYEFKNLLNKFLKVINHWKIYKELMILMKLNLIFIPLLLEKFHEIGLLI